MKTCIAVRHVAFEDLGGFEGGLTRAGFAVRYVEAWRDDLSVLDTADLTVILGGPIGAYQDDLYPFLAEETRRVEARLKADRPTIGLCLGSQVMARALGARVYANPKGKEIGWAPVELTEAGLASPLAALDGVPVLHWHGDTFDLPDGATLLASTAVTPHQAFSWGRAAVALQFHPEAAAAGLEGWYVGHTGEIAATPGLSVSDLRAAGLRHAPGLEDAAERMLASFLSDMM